MKNDLALAVHQLTVNYDQTPVLWDITLEIPKGKLIGIIGPNGAGKSTFLKTCLDLVKPISGSVELFGSVAYVPQRESVDWNFPITVRELVLMGRYGRLGLFRWPRQADWQAVDYYLETVGMSAYADRQISQLSGGQQQRVFIARALMQEADIYFMDEPFAGIDLATENLITQVLKSLIAKGKTIFVVHHDLNTVEKTYDWIIMLNMRLVAYGPTVQMFNPDTLAATYGKNFALLEEALKLSQNKNKGMDV